MVGGEGTMYGTHTTASRSSLYVTAKQMKTNHDLTRFSPDVETSCGVSGTLSVSGREKSKGFATYFGDSRSSS